MLSKLKHAQFQVFIFDSLFLLNDNNLLEEKKNMSFVNVFPMMRLYIAGDVLVILLL